MNGFGKWSSHPVVPVLVAASGIATFSLMDALMKLASIEGGAYAAMFWRGALGAIIVWPLWRWQARGAWPGRRLLGLHCGRSAVSTLMGLLFFWGLVRTPMAVGMALSFIAPLIALYLAALFLGEPITRKALMASALGLAGVVVIGLGRLGDGGFAHGGWLGVLAILGSAVLYAVSLVMQRHQAQLAAPIEIAFFQSACIAAYLAPGLAFVPIWPPHAMVWAYLGGAAALAAVSIGLLSWAWARAQAHRLLPVEYSAFIWAALSGWLWFDESLEWATLAGVVLIILGCWWGTRGSGEVAHVEPVAL